MKREELAELGLAAETVDKLMALHGRDVEKHKAAVQEWQQKYETDLGALREQAAEVSYGAAEKNALRGVVFSSESAKKTFAAELRAAGLPVENGVFSGFEDFAAQYRAADPAAFLQEPDPKAPVLVQTAVRPTGSADIGVANGALRHAFGL
ncbi:MAG: hypothetical protein RRZ93_08025 [Ruthenibacterium sp.]